MTYACGRGEASWVEYCAAGDRSGVSSGMADDPRRSVLHQWRGSIDAQSHRQLQPQSRQNAVPERRNAEQQPRPGTVVRRPSPPSVARDAALRPAPGVNGRTVGVVLQHSAIRTDGPSNGFRDEKGERDPADAAVATRKRHHYQHHQTQQRAPTATDSYSVQRERLRRMQQRYAELQQAMQARTTSSSSTTSAVATYHKYYEMVSPVRPVEGAEAAAPPSIAMAARQAEENADAKSNQAEHQQPSPRRHPPSRRRSPEDVMQEMDKNLWQSFSEHQRLSVSMSRDAAEMEDVEVHNDDAGDTPVGRSNPPTSPPPVVPVRVHEPPPPFREEISSDASDFVRSPPPSTSMTMDENGDPYVSQYVPTSADLGVHLPMSSDFESIPSISMSPPSSPKMHDSSPEQAGPAPQVRSNQASRERYARSVSSTANDVIPSTNTVFPPWSLGFLAGCIVAGSCGIFMEELLEVVGVFFKTTLSKTERREMNRRLDLLHQELATFRAAAHEIELQSQHMVEEVRLHLDRMKQERTRHQEIISHEMETLRLYVQGVANELVEDEKREIRKHLMETIENAVAERSEVRNQEEQVAATAPPEGPSSDAEGPSSDAEVTKSTAEHLKEDHIAESNSKSAENASAHDRKLPEAVEIEVSVETSEVKAHDPLDEAVIARQVEAANTISVPDAQSEISPLTVSDGTHGQLPGQSHSSSSSFVTVEWVMLIVGVIAIAGAVGYKLQRANLRRTRFRNRRMWRSRHHVEETKSKLSDESDVETVSFMRGASESEADGGVEEEEEDDVVDSTSVFSDEEEKHDDNISSDGEYEFHTAHLSEEIEPLDDSPARVSTSQSRQSRRLLDASPLMRRSPRFPRRSQLSSMR